jgi:hypothetical protein
MSGDEYTCQLAWCVLELGSGQKHGRDRHHWSLDNRFGSCVFPMFAPSGSLQAGRERLVPNVRLIGTSTIRMCTAKAPTRR